MQCFWELGLCNSEQFGGAKLAVKSVKPENCVFPTMQVTLFCKILQKHAFIDSLLFFNAEHGEGKQFLQ